MRTVVFTIVLLLIVGSVRSKVENEATPTGSICIAPFLVMSGDAALGRTITKETAFTFRFGSQKTVTLKQGESNTVSGLPVNEKILVQVLMDGKPYEAFTIDFGKFQSRQICMWLYFPHLTWQIYDYPKKGYGCKCFEKPVGRCGAPVNSSISSMRIRLFRPSGAGHLTSY